MLKYPIELRHAKYPFGYGFIGAEVFKESTMIFDGDFFYLTMLEFFESLKELV